MPMTPQTGYYLRPAIPLLVCLMMGMAVGTWLPGHAVVPAGLIIAACLAGLIRCLWRQKAARLLPLLLFMGLGYLSIQPWISPTFAADHIIHFIEGCEWTITGTVADVPIQKGHYLNFILEVQTLSDGKESHAVQGKVRVTAAGKAADMVTGDRVAFAGRMRSIRNFNNPGGFDYRRFLALQGIWASAYAAEGGIRIIPGQGSNRFSRLIDSARQRIVAFMGQNIHGDHRHILGALIVGDLSPIPPGDRDTFNRAGVGHLLAISGDQIGIIAAFFFFCFGRLLRQFDFFLWRGWTRKGAALLSFWAVLLYGELAGMAPSTQRAVIMVAVFLLSFVLGRRQDGLNILAIAALLILIFHPPFLLSVSFQLSFAAVTAIIVGVAKTGIGPQAAENRMAWIRMRIVLFLGVSLLAILGTLPLVLYYFNQVSLIALLANCIAIPAIGFVVVPVALVAVFCLPFSPSLSGVGIRLSAAVLEQALKWIRWFSDLPFAAVHTVTPGIIEITCYYLLLWAGLNLISGRRNQNKEQGNGNSQKQVCAVAFLACAAFTIDCGYWVCHRFWRKDFQVTFLDVGAGNSALVEMPMGHTMLIDGGGFPDNAVFDVGERIVAPFLWRRKIRTIDTLVLTHADSDHLNGLLFIVRHFSVTEIWFNGEVVASTAYQQWIEAVRSKRIPMPAFREIPKKTVIHGVTVDLLHPSFTERMGKGQQRDVNGNSIVLRICHGDSCVLFPGDIPSSIEEELVRSCGGRLKSNILLAPHHGSKTSSSEIFLNTVAPEVVVVSTRPRGWIRLPHPAVAERYRRLGIRVFQTDRHGALTVSSDGHGYDILPTIQ